MEAIRVAGAFCPSTKSISGMTPLPKKRRRVVIQRRAAIPIGLASMVRCVAEFPFYVLPFVYFFSQGKGHGSLLKRSIPGDLDRLPIRCTNGWRTISLRVNSQMPKSGIFLKIFCASSRPEWVRSGRSTCEGSPVITHVDS